MIPDGLTRPAGGSLSRRGFVGRLAVAGALLAVGSWPRRLLAHGTQLARRAAARAGALGARTIDLSIGSLGVNVTGRRSTAVAINGTVPGPLLRLREGEELEINVTNRLGEATSIHWHGMLVPAAMDGVPGVSFPGIAAGETFTYRYKVRQSGTYWYHSHSGAQESKGHYAPIVIDPAGPEPYPYDRDYVIMFADWSDEEPLAILANLKRDPSYYNYNRRTIPDFLRALLRAPSSTARKAVVRDRLAWARMRMDPTDISDVTGATYTFLVNGKSPRDNWTALFTPGERVRLRMINAAAMTYFDVRIPGLTMTVVQADGQDIEPVEVDELRMSVAETYDVIVTPRAGAYTIFAQAMDRSGYARGTLAEREGMSAPIPPMDARPIAPMPGMDMSDVGMPGMRATEIPTSGLQAGDTNRQSPVRGAASDTVAIRVAPAPGQDPEMPGMRREGPVSAIPRATKAPDRTEAPEDPAMPGMRAQAETRVAKAGDVSARRRVLRYDDLRARTPNRDTREPEATVVVRLTGDMQRYFWTLNGRQLSGATPIPLRQGQRMRMSLVNETMMPHPMHLHGVFIELHNGQPPAFSPRKHTVNVAPFTTVVADFTFEDPGPWAFHCHLLFHLATGMMTTLHVAPSTSESDAPR